MKNYNSLKNNLLNCKNMLLLSTNDEIIKLCNELNMTYAIFNKNFDCFSDKHDVVYCNLIDVSTNMNDLNKLANKLIILENITDDENVNLFMEHNDEWIYDNDDWTIENKIIVVKKKESYEKNIICVIKENGQFYNQKAFELFDYYFKNNYKLVKKNIINVFDFINDKNKKNNVLVFIHATYLDEFDYNVVSYIQNFKNNFDSQIYIIEIDWWVAASYKRVTENNFRKDILRANNYKLIVNVDNVSVLSNFNNVDCFNFKNNIICYNCWNIYKSAIVEFNKNPIKKILLSGCTARSNYPERSRLRYLNNKYIEFYEYNNNDICETYVNNFSKKLNEHLCCFTSSVHVVNIKNMKIENTHVILLKVFEILASGSLLIVPDYEEPYLKKLGLINGEHYLTLDFSKKDNNVCEQINNLFETNNLSHIDKVRLNGYNFGINNLTNEIKFKELHKLFTIDSFDDM